jgi:hypothetical protein
MSSSSDDGGGSYAGSGTATPMPNLPIAGKDAASVPDAYNYGKFQSFLPDVKASGVNPMATGLTPDMFTYKSPSGVAASNNSSDAGNQISSLRDELASLTSTLKSVQSQQGSNYSTGPADPVDTWTNRS